MISTQKDIFGWIKEIVALGDRKPGSEGDERTRQYIKDKLQSFGLEVAPADPFPVDTHTVQDWNFELYDETTGELILIPSYYIAFCGSTDGKSIQGNLVYIDKAEELDQLDVRGKIVLFEQATHLISAKRFPENFFVYDPDHTIENEPDVLSPVASVERRVYNKIIDRGAIGMVGLLSGLEWESDRFCPQMNEGLKKTIPGVWVGPGQSKVVKAWLKRGAVTGRLKLDSQFGRGMTENFWAELKGAIDEYYIVLGHHDSYFDGAVQDASGVSVVMALAKYLSRVKEEQPLKRGILFLNVGAHTLGRLGESYFVTKHKDGILSKTALVVSVEHIGKRFMPQRDRSFKTDEFHLFRSFLITNNKQIEKMVESAIKNNDFRRSLVVPQEFVLKATGKARGISGEFYEAGFPVVGLLSSPNYLFFKEDTPEAVAEDQLVPTVEVILSILRAADDYPIETFKEGES